MSAPVATGISYGTPGTDHATLAVQRALARAGLNQANSVILYLSCDYAGDPYQALRNAARAAGCTQVFGCTAAGLVTDEDWVLDSSAAAAMVLGGHLTLVPETGIQAHILRVSLSTPDAIDTEWLDQPKIRVGAVSSDVFGHGPFAVWQAARCVSDGHTHVCVNGADSAVAVGQGVRALTAPLEVAETEGLEIRRLGPYPALNVLINALPPAVRRMERIPLHLLMCGVTFGEPSSAIRDGRFRLDHIVSANVDDHSITLSQELHRGERLFWAIRDKLSAQRDMAAAVQRAHRALGHEPDFALLFPCLSRGPSFYGDRDRDAETLASAFPKLPFIGFYGNGEIAPLAHSSHLSQHTTTIALFAAH